MNSPHIAYREAAVHGASGFGLLVALYDTLISDLRRAADAQSRGDIQRRGKEANHALLVLGFLENWVDREREGELAMQLLTLYSRVRKSIIAAQIRQSADMLQQYVPELLKLQAMWQKMQLRSHDAPEQTSRSSTEPLSESSYDFQQETACWSA